MNIKDFNGDDGIYRIKEGDCWDALIKVIDGRQVYELRNDDQDKYFESRKGLVNLIRDTFTIEPATEQEKLHFNMCLEAGKYVDPPVLVADFEGPSGIYEVSQGDSKRIIRIIGDKYVAYMCVEGGYWRSDNLPFKTTFINNWTIRPANEQQCLHMSACIDAGKYVPIEDLGSVSEFEGKWNDFHKEDGDYFVEYGNIGWIVRFLNGEDTCRIFDVTGGCEFFKVPRNSWSKLSHYKISRATKEQSEHLDLCVKHDCYIDPPKSLETTRELEDGYYKIKNILSTWLAKFEGGQVIADIHEDENNISFNQNGIHWSTDGLSASKPTENEIDWLDRCISAGQLVPKEVDKDEIVFKGDYIDFSPGDGDYVIKSAINTLYLTRYKNGKFIGEIVNNTNWFATNNTWRQYNSIEVKKATPMETKQLDASILKGKYLPMDQIDLVEINKIKENQWSFEGEYKDFEPGSGYYHISHHNVSYLTKYENGTFIGEIQLKESSLCLKDTWSPYHTIKVRKATDDEILQLDQSIVKGTYVCLKEAKLVELSSRFPPMIDNTILGVSHPDKLQLNEQKQEIQQLRQVIDQQQEQINKLSQTWIQRIKNVIGPLV